jgi:hypothetical protein
MPDQNILSCSELPPLELSNLLQPYGIELEEVASNLAIPGSFWGDSEAGLIENRLYIRPDTPVHSALHEACHFICMDAVRRDGLDTDAGGDFDEENGVCYLQILLAANMPSVGSERLMQDMDAWGYSFRLGSTQAWFTQDAEDAQDWLLDHGIIDESSSPTGRKRS